jgi:threonine dehydratase
MELASWRARIEAAADRIAPHARRTGLERSAWLSEATGAEVWLKLEHQQRTGSFKFRGALSRLSALNEEERARGVIVASSGNHGAACALAGSLLGIPVRVFTPTYATPTKQAKIRRAGAALELVGEDCLETEGVARARAEAEGLPYISPYDDPEVLAGQGTIGLEIAADLPDVDGVIVAVGGGGLIAGIGSALKSRPHSSAQNIEIVAASPARSPAVHACWEARRYVEATCLDTLSDATAGGVDPNSVTLPLCYDLVDRSLLVEEERIAPVLRALFEEEGMLVEGAAGVAVAALLDDPAPWRGRRVVIPICGGNLGLDQARQVLAS